MGVKEPNQGQAEMLRSTHVVQSVKYLAIWRIKSGPQLCFGVGRTVRRFVLSSRSPISG